MNAINYHDMPVASVVKTMIADTIADINNESTVFDFDNQLSDVAEHLSFATPFEEHLFRSLQMVIQTIYSNGIVWEGEPLTVGLDGSDDGSFERYVVELASTTFQRIVDAMADVYVKIGPNRLFGNGQLS